MKFDVTICTSKGFINDMKKPTFTHLYSSHFHVRDKDFKHDTRESSNAKSKRTPDHLHFLIH